MWNLVNWMARRKQLYLSHSLCSSQSNSGSRPFGKKIIFRHKVKILNIQSHLEGQKVNFKVKYDNISSITNTVRNAYNSSFSWTDKIQLWHYFGDSRPCSMSISIQGHEKVNSEVKNVKIRFLTNVDSKTNVVRLLMNFDWILCNYFDD